MPGSRCFFYGSFPFYSIFIFYFLQKLTESLKEAHMLLNRHVQSINKHSELETIAHLELDEIKTECQSLKETLNKEKEVRKGIEETLKNNETEWETQVLRV